MSRAGDTGGGRRTVTGGLKRVTGRPTAKRKPGGRLASRAWLGLELTAFRGPICGARHLAQASFRCREERTGGQGDRKLGEGLAERKRREVTGAGGGGERPQGDGAGRVAAPESGHGTLRESLCEPGGCGNAVFERAAFRMRSFQVTEKRWRKGMGVRRHRGSYLSSTGPLKSLGEGSDCGRNTLTQSLPGGRDPAPLIGMACATKRGRGGGMESRNAREGP